MRRGELLPWVRAEDATQDVLIKVLAGLESFRGESEFSTWVHRITVNHVTTVLQRRSRDRTVTFDDLDARLELSLSAGQRPVDDQVEWDRLTDEVRRSCTQAMLTCLSPDKRILIVLAEVLELSTEQCAAILGITPVAARKRLSRARAELVGFVSRRCGIVNAASPCRCEKHVGNRIAVGTLDPALAGVPPVGPAERAQVKRAQDLTLSATCRTTSLVRAGRPVEVTDRFRQSVQLWIEAGAPYESAEIATLRAAAPAATEQVRS